jgi:DNA processing protein
MGAAGDPARDYEVSEMDRASYISLALTPGIGASRMAALLERFGTASEVLAASPAGLLDVRSISPAAATAISERSAADGEKALEQVRALGGQCLLPSDEAFPEVLREIPDPPTLVFALGDLEALARPAVAIVGSRDHTAYGAEVCRTVAGAAAESGVVVVSGMARGLDAIAHSTALAVGGTTIGVLGNGLGVIYPAANRTLYQAVAERGLLLTEFPPGERPGAGAFPRRNRLISALARVTVVVEAAEGSGTMITVSTALAQGRDVMAVPGNITSPTSVGTNRLLRDGAEPLLELEDLLAHFPELGGSAARRLVVDSSAAEPAPSGARARLGGSVEVREPLPPPGLKPVESALFGALAAGPATLDDLVRQTGASVPEVLSAVSALELRGILAEVRGVLALTPALR